MRSFTKIHGGKARIHARITALFCHHNTYVEPYVGAGSVFLNRPREPIEFISDIDPALMNCWQIVRDEAPALAAIIADIDYKEKQFAYSLAQLPTLALHPLHWAAHFLVVSKMSRGGIGKDYASPGVGDDRLRGGHPDNVNAWKTTPDAILEVSARIQYTIISCMPALKAIYAYMHNKKAIIYLDPPYLPSTRVSNSVYDYEMSGDDHLVMLNAILDSDAAVYLSGYPSEMYSDILRGWDSISWEVPNNSGQNDKKQSRTETVWSNRIIPR